MPCAPHRPVAAADAPHARHAALPFPRAQAGAAPWGFSPLRQPESPKSPAAQTVERSQLASAATLNSVIQKLMLAEQVRATNVNAPLFACSRLTGRVSPPQNGEVSAEVAASVRASLQHLQGEAPGRGAQLRQLIQEARPQLPPPPRQPPPPPLMWDAAGLRGVISATAGAAPPLKRTATNMQQPQQQLPSFHDTFFVANGPGMADGARGAAPSLPMPESAAAARRAREARQAKRREKTTTAAAAAPMAATAGASAPAADGSSPRSGDVATSMGAVAAAALNARLDSLEKEHRSAAMRLQFMNRQHSEMTLKIESLEARNAALVKENERLTGLWRACPLARRCVGLLARGLRLLY